MFNKQNDLDKELQKAESETISSIIDKSMVISGEIDFKGKTRIDGTINGDITGEHLVLSESGKITGNVKVSSFICHGSINGNIVASLVNARKGCSIHGSLEAASLSVEPGAAIDGEVRAAAQHEPPVPPITTEIDENTSTPDS
jgi:cytoskeletal protein CcmA (bactofilin family)